jgi:hypothetical protein
VKIVEHDDEAGWCAAQVSQEQAGKSDALSAIVEAAAQLRDGSGVVEACGESIGQTSEKAP